MVPLFKKILNITNDSKHVASVSNKTNTFDCNLESHFSGKKPATSKNKPSFVFLNKKAL